MKVFVMLQNYCKIRRLKKLCLCPAYFAGSEMYRLLNYNILQGLVKNIKPGNVVLSSDLLFNKKVITTEEQFLYILNKYIVFVRDYFFISQNELIGIIEETLKSKYSKILYNNLEFNKENNFKVYYIEFKRMFLDNFFNNFKKFYNEDITGTYFEELKNFSLDNDEDVEKLFSLFKTIISYRHKNLFNFFVDSSSDSSEYAKRFYSVQWKTLIGEYKKAQKALDILIYSNNIK